MTSTQELNELRLWIEEATEGELECRLGHHSFVLYRYREETSEPTVVWTEWHRCSRNCGTKMVLEVPATTGIPLNRWLDYAECEHYRITGLGRMTQTDHGMMRLELHRRRLAELKKMARVA